MTQVVGGHLVDLGLSKNRGNPQIIHFNKVFHYKPSILGYHYFLETSILRCLPGKSAGGLFVRDGENVTLKRAKLSDLQLGNQQGHGLNHLVLEFGTHFFQGRFDTFLNQLPNFRGHLLIHFDSKGCLCQEVAV